MRVSRDVCSVHMYHIATMFPKMDILYTYTIQQQCFPRCMFCTHIPYSNNVPKMYVLYTYTMQQQCSQDVCSVHIYHTATMFPRCMFCTNVPYGNNKKKTNKKTDYIFISAAIFTEIFQDTVQCKENMWVPLSLSTFGWSGQSRYVK